MTEQTFTAMRRAMVESQLRTNDVSDIAVIEAILAEPRELYVPETRRSAAYIDRAVPLVEGRALNPPLATARLIVEAVTRPGERVLLIGGASGYAAALLARLGCDVVAVEESAPLVEMARAALGERPGITLVTGPLVKGHAEGAPYDLLFVDGAVEELGEALIAQLKAGGRAVFGRVERGVTRLCSGVKTEGGFGARAFSDSEAAVLPGFAKPKTFTF